MTAFDETSHLPAILQVCLECRNGILADARDLDARELEYSNSIREYLAPVLDDGGTIYRRASLNEEISPPAPGSERKRLGDRLAPLAKGLWNFLQETTVDCDCPDHENPGPWLTFVIVDQADVFQLGWGDAADPRYIFHSFGIVDSEDPRDWYAFLDEQQEGAPEKTFILSSLFYSSWLPAAGPDVTFRIHFSPEKMHSFPAPEAGFIDLFIHAPDKAHWPLKVVCDHSYDDLRRAYDQWSHKVGKLRKGGSYEGVRRYVATINRFLGAGSSGWVLYGFPVPSFGKQEPSSGLYMLMPTAPCARCKSRLREISFLLSSTLWPLDHLRRQRAMKEQAEDLREWKEFTEQVLDAAHLSQARMWNDINAVIKSERSDQAQFRHFLVMLDQIESESSLPEIRKLMKRMYDALRIRNEPATDALPETKKALEELGSRGATVLDDSVQHHVGSGRYPDLAKRLAADLGSLCRAALRLWDSGGEFVEFKEKLARRFGEVVEIDGEGTSSFSWPVALRRQDKAAHAVVRAALMLEIGLEGVDVHIDDIQTQRWNLELPIVGFLVGVLFRGGRSEREPRDPKKISVLRTSSEWHLTWKLDPDLEDSVEDFLHSTPLGKSAAPGERLPQHITKLADRAKLVSTLLSLRHRGGALRIEVQSGTALFRINLGHWFSR
ncbi:MAG TPA: hypothetical protein VGO40_22535 [Longimicrobium sp.]|nr:hypothetical protein [Longimicrobium sp.]